VGVCIVVGSRLQVGDWPGKVTQLDVCPWPISMGAWKSLNPMLVFCWRLGNDLNKADLMHVCLLEDAYQPEDYLYHGSLLPHGGLLRVGEGNESVHGGSAKMGVLAV